MEWLDKQIDDRRFQSRSEGIDYAVHNTMTEEKMTEEKGSIAFTPELKGREVTVKLMGGEVRNCKIEEIRGDEIILSPIDGGKDMLVFKSSIISMEPYKEGVKFDLEALGDVSNEVFYS
jgi:Arc/MetJ-type ribon-helix-helix transcriptional regulator